MLDVLAVELHLLNYYGGPDVLRWYIWKVRYIQYHTTRNTSICTGILGLGRVFVTPPPIQINTAGSLALREGPPMIKSAQQPAIGGSSRQCRFQLVDNAYYSPDNDSWSIPAAEWRPASCTGLRPVGVTRCDNPPVIDSPEMACGIHAVHVPTLNIDCNSDRGRGLNPTSYYGIHLMIYRPFLRHGQGFTWCPANLCATMKTRPPGCWVVRRGCNCATRGRLGRNYCSHAEPVSYYNHNNTGRLIHRSVANCRYIPSVQGPCCVEDCAIYPHALKLWLSWLNLFAVESDRGEI